MYLQQQRQAYKVLRYNVRINLYNGIASSIAVNLVVPFVGIFAIRLGASDFEVSLLNSLPAFFAIAAMMPAAAFTERAVDKKRIIGILILTGRAFFILMALVPFLPADIRPMTLVLLYGLMNLPISIMSVTWQSFIADIIPPRQRSSVFAVRNIWISIAGSAVLLVGGWMLDAISFPIGYQIVFLIAFVAAIFEFYYFMSIKEVNVASTGGTNVKSSVLAFMKNGLNNAIHNPSFAKFSIVTLLYHFSWMMAWPIFTVYKVDVLGANNTWMSIYALSGSVASILFFRYWGKLADKRSNRFALAITGMGLALCPASLMFIHSLELVIISDFIGGVFTAGFNLVFFNRVLEIAPDNGRTGYIAFITTLVQVAATISPMIGIWLYETLGFFATMLITAIFRLVGGWLYFRV